MVTKEQIGDQASHSLADVVRYVPGVGIDLGEGHRDQIILRGQNTTASFFLDGVRDDVQYFRGLYNVERIEILKGPSALIFGRGGGGGVVNRVQKTPMFEKPAFGAGASINSFGAYDLTADLNAPINANIAVRLNANYENLNSNRDYYAGERYAWNPSAAAKLGENWTLGLSYEYVNDNRVVDRGIASFNAKPIEGLRDRFFGVPGINRTRLEAQIAKLRLDGAVWDNLTFSSTILFGDYDKVYSNILPAGPATSLTGTVPLSGYVDATRRKNFIAEAHFVWDIATGLIDHKILFGGEYGNQKTDGSRRNAILSNSNFSLTNPVFPTVAFGPLARNTTSDLNFASAFVQDQISFGDHFDVVAGFRYDHFAISGIDFITTIPRPFARTDNKFSPRLGAIYKPRENMSFYASYSESFLPRSGEQFGSLTTITQNLAPEKFVNYEVGAKWDVDAGWSLTAALYQLDRTNATLPDPNNPLVTINVGGTRTQGGEIGINGKILPGWQVSGGYAYQEGALHGNSAVLLPALPKHKLSLWNRYDVTDSFGIGVGIIHQSSQLAAIRTVATTTILPAYTRIDAAVFYDISDNVQVQANVENLFDAGYFPESHTNNNILPGAPINGRISVKLKF